MEGAWVALVLTLKVAGWATALNLLLGVGIGFAIARARFPGATCSTRCSRCRW
jgi:molybdate transport system permease protein